jgi:crotonobetainyl-CoA:carnitine CoA-transferase CaiB-like acyl-CoA transferase
MTNPSDRPSPLAGYRVLDLSRVLAGPWCGMVLGDLGADVIKVEHPSRGDDTRHWGAKLPGGESCYYFATNRNKRGIAVDLSKKEGQQIIRDIARESDVVIENYKNGDLRRYGLDYESLRDINSQLVYCSISGYGRTGPGADRLGYDVLIQAESGLMAVTGEPEGSPMKVGVPISDLLAGLHASQAILAALIARPKVGKGQYIDIALMDCTLAALSTVAVSALHQAKAPERFGNAHPDIVPYEAFPASDGDVIVAIGNDEQFSRLCTIALERPDLGKDARYKTSRDRLANREELVRTISDIIRQKPRHDWDKLFAKASVPAGGVKSFLETARSGAGTGRGLIKTVKHSVAGDVQIVGSPLFMEATPVVEPSPPPMLGQHTTEVLEQFGLSKEWIAELRDRRVIA